MKNKYLTQHMDTNKFYVMLPLGTKNVEWAEDRADAMVNDLLSAITCAEKAHKDSPDFLKSLAQIKKRLWKML